MSDKDSTIFERRFEEWSITHPKRWIPATDRESVAEFISNQTEKIVSAQLKAADRIIVSQDRIASGIDKVAVGVDRVADGLEGLASAFEWGFSEMVWQLEQQRTILEEILKVLQAPLDTQAKELKKRAENAYWNGWIDDALEDFLESEKKNKYDFTIHQSLGNIYLFHKKRPWKALEYYEKATKYASPESSYHASIALLHVGLIKYFACDFQGAYEATSKTIELSPNLYEAYYQRSQYCANLGKYDEAIENLQKAIEGDRYYCLKADSEKDFDVMREQLHSFFEDRRNKAENEVEEEIDKAQELILNAESYHLFTHGRIVLRIAKKKASEAEEFLRGATLFDCWDGIYEASIAQKVALDSLADYYSKQILRTTEKDNKQKKKLETRAKFCLLCLIVVFVTAVVAGIIVLGTSGVCPGIALLIIGGYTFYFLAGSISELALKFFVKKSKVHQDYESKLAKLQDHLSEIQSKQVQLGSYSFKDELGLLYTKLPNDLQEGGYSKEAAGNIHEICTKNGVTNDNALFEVARYTGYVLLGILPPDEFQEALEEEVNLYKAVAERIAREISRSVFLPVKDSLDSLYREELRKA